MNDTRPDNWPGRAVVPNRTAGSSRRIYKVALVTPMNEFQEFPEDSRYESLSTLLAMPDPPDLPPRRHRRTFEGELSRKDRIKWELAAAYVGHRMQLHAAFDAVVSVRRLPLRLVKKTA